jgi:ribA/ribD-fused uncharacterized protein
MAELPKPGAFKAFTPFIKGVFSQWHRTPFWLNGIAFGTAEQWMMHSKARLFNDIDIANQIAQSTDPAEQKRLGQTVREFDQATWDRWKIDLVYQGNLAKFGQNEGAFRQLRNTTPTLLVEANPRDWVWGVGLAIDDPTGHAPDRWRGQNLLGLILTKVRDDLTDCT